MEAEEPGTVGHALDTAVGLCEARCDQPGRFGLCDAGPGAFCHRLWRDLGHESAVTDAAWPVADQNALHVDTVEIVVQVNGKLRARIQSPTNASNDALQDAALGDENVRRFIADKNIRKIIVVPGKLVNVVV